MKLTADSTCSYRGCNHTGHQVCLTVFGHYERLIAAITLCLNDERNTIDEDQVALIRDIILEDPDTRTP